METETQRNWNKFYHNEKPKNKLPIGLIIAIAIITSSIIIGTLIKNDNPTTAATNIEIAAQNHNIKATEIENGIEEIHGILEKLPDVTEPETIDTYIKTISSLEMDANYDKFKSQMSLKLQYYKSFLNTKDGDYLPLFSSIDFIEELSKAFDRAGVKYKISNDNHIVYWIE